MLFDAVFYADSEYHVYSAFKSIIDSQNLEIRGHFLTFCHQFRKKLIFSTAEHHFSKPILAIIRHRLTVRMMYKCVKEKDLIGLREQGVTSFLARISRSWRKWR